MWPKKNTAFVVIHGSGSHRPFETLDTFARGFRDCLLDSNPELDRWWRHRLLRRSRWIEHYLSLAPEGKPVIDFFEYYWDFYIDHQIDLTDVINWLGQISESAKRFYRARPDLAKTHERMGSELFLDGDFKAGGYFVLLGRVGQLLAWLQQLGLARIPIVSSATALVLRRIHSWLRELMGDVVIYTLADVRSKNYASRQRVLNGAVAHVLSLISTNKYQQIILVGHSLGSVIAYDALNSIALHASAKGGVRRDQVKRIRGLVTLGSPLDKVAFFFRDYSHDDQFLRRQIQVQQHGFKSRALFPVSDPAKVVSPIYPCLNGIEWLNFYHLQDPVGGHLDAYAVDANVLCAAQTTSIGEAHRMYWTHKPVYEQIAETFFRGVLEPFLP